MARSIDVKLAVLAVLGACSAPAVHAPLSAQGQPSDARASDSTLVLLSPEAERCALHRIDPVLKRDDVLARISGSCLGARIAWRAKLDRVVVWFAEGNVYNAGDQDVGAPKPGHASESELPIKPRAVEVDLATGTVTPLPLDAGDAAQEVAYGADGSLYLFAEVDVPQATGKVTVRGHELDFTDLGEGMPAAALAYRRTGDAWKLVSVTRTTTGWDYAAGWGAAPEAQGLGPRSYDLLDAHADAAELSAAELAPLERFGKPRDDRDGWVRVGSLFVWTMTGEFQYTMGRIAWRRAGRIELLPDLDFSASDFVSIQQRGDFVLVASSSSGAFPRLYQLSTHRRVWTSDTARATTFWPTSL